MGWFSRDKTPEYRTGSLAELTAGVEPIELTEDGVLLVAAPEGFYERQEPPTRAVRLDDTTRSIQAELGTARSHFSSFVREEYNPKLRGLQGLREYDKMRRSDASVRASLQAIKSPITGATWFVQPADESEGARLQADFVRANFDTMMTYSWNNVLAEALAFLDFGYYMFEKVWEFREFRGERRLVLRKLAARHPMDVLEDGWKFDRHGGPIGVEMYDTDGHAGEVYIPIEKLVVFTNDKESGDLTGRSVLRSAYKHWFFKENAYKIDGIQKERHGIGIPIIKLPPGFSDADKAVAHEIGRNLRTNEAAHVVLPPIWEIMFAKLEGQPVSALETAEHHARMIFQNVLAQALWASHEGDGDAMMDLFYKSLRQLANNVADVMNQYCIPQLIDFNFPNVEAYPKLKVRRLGDVAEARTVSFALRNMVGAGVIRPDDDLELWAREMIDAPEAQPSTLREVASPQLPRQSKASNQRNQPGRNSGNDGSGG